MTGVRLEAFGVWKWNWAWTDKRKDHTRPHHNHLWRRGQCQKWLAQDGKLSIALGIYDIYFHWLFCLLQNPGDAENMGPVEFYPPNGMPIHYYPYLNQRGYRQPIVFAKFRAPKEGVVMQIWCKAWASNIMHHKNDKAGSIHFELLVD